MRLVNGCAIAVALTLCTSSFAFAQDAAVAVKDGGVFAKGWAGKIDAQEEKAGANLNQARLDEKGGTFMVRTGPATTYWNPANKAAGSYTVSATFNEPKYMNLMDHPHPYGIVIGGNDMGTDQQSYLYCTAYGNGKFIVRGFGPAAFQLNGRGEAKEAIHKAAGQGQPVSQEIAVSVKGDAVQLRDQRHGGRDVQEGRRRGCRKLKSTDGVYGVRFGHNTEATVTGLTMTKN
jgi:hypothetical protein